MFSVLKSYTFSSTKICIMHESYCFDNLFSSFFLVSKMNMSTLLWRNDEWHSTWSLILHLNYNHSSARFCPDLIAVSLMFSWRIVTNSAATRAEKDDVPVFKFPRWRVKGQPIPEVTRNSFSSKIVWSQTLHVLSGCRKICFGRSRIERPPVLLSVHPDECDRTSATRIHYLSPFHPTQTSWGIGYQLVCFWDKCFEVYIHRCRIF